MHRMTQYALVPDRQTEEHHGNSAMIRCDERTARYNYYKSTGSQGR